MKSTCFGVAVLLKENMKNKSDSAEESKVSICQLQKNLVIYIFPRPGLLRG